ncbi:amidoligase [Pontibacter diazotrophicus]|uniref:Amidoligase n=1 Tax=Pontibacter diazotrophicus TaxID=1400979 RepID=A0A3D8LIZ1_9BACT|nr:amidoligase family protein [Pontibacter diazotrophicus]RDV16902.1 amidoligase [Pontibacter diazotrophicus]
MQYKELPVQHNAKGELRKVGFELEYANVGIEESVKIIQALYGGKEEIDHRFSRKVTGTSVGDFSVEIDLRLLNEKTYKEPLDKLNINLKDISIGDGTLEDEVETAMESVINKVIPYEITTPPVPYTEIEVFEKLRQSLYEHNAKGTEAFITNAFATHINPEVPDTDADTILRYINAFLLLYPWLLKEGETDMARRMTAFINPFPAEYAELVLQPSYHPDMEMLIEDYHRLNPDRNRPLDMYPFFAAVRKEQVNSYTDLGKVKARETFHYRLPNSWVSKPNWTLAKEWNNWVVLEELANDPDRLEQMSKEYLALKDDTLIGFDSKWIKQTEQWLS